ncbi:MAG: formate dehydrogenase subunit gamma [Betaproteobacteria bacterium]|nr:formate dehydrogenase subunit gamma [Betaproteobacteria bacterium]
MKSTFARGIGALVVALAAWLPFGASAQQPAATQPAAAAQEAAPAPKPAAGTTAGPGWNNPPSWNDVSTQQQYASVPGRETNVLIQGAGHEWRKIRNGPVTFYGGIVLLIPLAVLVLFYLAKGPIKVHDPLTGRLIERFSSVERVAHWTMGLSFVVLALTGIVILFGKYILLPIVGHAAFAGLTVLSKNLHNFVGPLFIFALVIFITLFIRENLWKSYDGQWLGKFGGLLSGEHVPSGKFNAGEKVLFWTLVVGLCTVISVTGLILNFPNWNQGREAMQLANVIHGICAILAMSMACFHIYLGTVGMQGALAAMKTGYVDETWAKEHHQYWYDEVKAGKRPEKVVAGSAQPATGD